MFHKSKFSTAAPPDIVYRDMHLAVFSFSFFGKLLCKVYGKEKREKNKPLACPASRSGMVSQKQEEDASDSINAFSISEQDATPINN